MAAADMTESVERLDAATSLPERRPPLWLLVLLSGLPLLLAGWLLMSRDIMLMQYNLTDLLFNLSGAWQFHEGRVQHVDFHEAVGPLNFLLTQAGFYLVGFSPFAFLAGQMLAVAGLFVMAVAVAVRRLPLAASILFVLFVALQAMMPTNVGNPPTAFTFAMAYNRYGWSAIAILCLLLFAPPRWSRSSDVVDVLCGTLLLFAMFYIKITYFMVGLGALALALLISDHIRIRWHIWLAIWLLALGNTLAPYSQPYLADLWWAIISGLPATGARRLLVDGVLGNSWELSVYGAGLIACIWLWRRGLAPVGLPLAALFLIGAGVMLFAQNTQAAGLPLGLVILFLLYGAIPRYGTKQWAIPAILLLAPAFTVAAAAGSIAAYAAMAVPSAKLLIARDTNARDIAVPMRSDSVNNLRSQTIYLSSLLDAASLFAPGRHPPGKIRTIDRVNPLPFMLGFPPPHGGDLFWEKSAPPRPTEEMLGDADYVLVPTQFSTAPGLSRAAHERFAPYLAAHFAVRDKTDYWILYARIASGR